MASVTLAPRYEAQSDSVMCVCVQRVEIVSEDVVSIAKSNNNRTIEVDDNNRNHNRSNNSQKIAERLTKLPTALSQLIKQTNLSHFACDLVIINAMPTLGHCPTPTGFGS